MSIIKIKFEEIIKVFKLEENSFMQRKIEIQNALITSVNWSSSYLDFYPYSSIINQLRPATIYKNEKTSSIKNFYSKGKLIFSCNNEDERWGNLFIDYDDGIKKSLLFVENDDNQMTLQQLKIAYFRENKYDKISSYLFSDDEESLIVDLFEYDANNNTQKIIRHGFFEERTNVLPVREFIFSYDEGNVEIFTKSGGDKYLSIYDGKIIT